MEAHAGNIIKKRLISFAFEKTPCISLNFKLVPVQYREYEYGLLLSPQFLSDPKCGTGYITALIPRFRLFVCFFIFFRLGFRS